MKKSIVRTIPILIAFTLMLVGCTGPVPKRPPKIPISPLAYKNKAIAYEKKRNLTKALEYWKITSSIDPYNAKIKGKTALLEAINTSFAKTHFKKGVRYYQKRQLKNARKEFMIALRHDPEHQQALNYLKNKFTRSAYKTYQVRKGDTYNKIAGKIYKDSSKGFLIANINRLAFTKKPRPGAILKIPRLDNIRIPSAKPREKPSDETETQPEPGTEMVIEESDISEPSIINPIIDIESELTDARNYFIAKNYPKVLPITQTILENDPQNNEALKLKNQAYLSMGKDLALKKKYTEAINMFNETDADFQGAKEAINDIKKQMSQEAEEHYRRGVKQYLREELSKAIEEWEKTLLLNPGHTKARKDIENARNLIKKLEKMK
ncbi:LysM peptidoglycan-binding domain-containing protein [Desulfococcaceae bacterium HSG9]|nr:LysM peptidoglycan-binding domain-containing protein [Desulfococcaceae bacterium HSG9]